MQENPETIPETIPENPEIVETIAEIPEKEPDPVPEPVPAAPKRRGRPEGARDRAPRKKKIVIVEEDPQPVVSNPSNSSNPEPEPVFSSNPVSSNSQEPAPEDSPRTLIRNASEHILKLKNVTKMARRAHLQETYTMRLHSLS